MTGWAALAQLGSDMFNAHQARNAMQFQHHGQRYAYRNAAIDLEKAGLNRVLALGSPAGSPTPMNAPMRNPAEAYFSAAQAKELIKTQEATQRQLDAQTAKAQAETRATDTATQIAAAKAPHEIANLQATNPSIVAGTEASRVRAALDAVETKLRDKQLSKEEVTKVLYDEFGPDAVGAVKGIRDAVSTAKGAPQAVGSFLGSTAADVVDWVKGFSARGRHDKVIESLPLHKVQNMAQEFVRAVEDGKAKREIMRDFNWRLRAEIVRLRPEWRGAK